MKAFLFSIVSLFTSFTSVFYPGNNLQKTLAKKRILDSSVVFEKQMLEDFALKKGYGFKTGNLEELKKVLSKITQFNVDVPEFVAISSDKIQNFLETQQINIADLWGKKIFPLETDKESVDFKEKLYNALKENIETPISERFNKLSSSDNLKQIFTKSFNSEEYNVYEMLEKFNKEGASLMIRSTGKEDTDSIANAGGNESIANVEATLAAVLKAMGVGHDENQLGVVSSYFGKKSFSQRLMVQDPELFEKPITPVLIQKMIGEQAGGATDPDNIPRVGVMFTEDAEGGIYKRTKETTGETTGITIIQASYGHNEGVVNSRVPVDTYLIDNNGNAYSVLRTKRKRLCPHNNSEKKDPFEELKNPGKLPSEPALDAKTILKLKIVAKVLEEYYKKPMDVEFVYFPATDTLHIVQARPITYKEGLPDPCYLENPEAMAEDKKVAATTIGSAGGALRVISKEEPVIIEADIKKALTKYSDLSPKAQESISCIIIGEHAPALSHEATTLRGEGKPVVYTKDCEKIEQWIKEQDYNILVDVQQEIIVNNKEKVELKRIDGWISYPTARLLSLDPNNAQTITLPVKNSPLNEYKNLFTAMKKREGVEALTAFNQLLTIVGKKEDEYKQQTKKNPQIIQRFKTLKKALLTCAINVAHALENYPANDVRRIFHVHFLEALFYQQPKHGEMLNGDSYIYLFDDIAREKECIEKCPEISIDSMELFKVSDFSLSPELKEQWKKFVTNLDSTLSLQEKQEFKDMVLFLNQQELISLWLNISFSQEIFAPEAATKDVAQSLLEEFNDSREFLEKIQEKSDELKGYNISIWEKSNLFKKNLKAFEEKFLNFFMHDEFLDIFVDENDWFDSEDELSMYFSFIKKPKDFKSKNKLKEHLSKLKKELTGERFLKKQEEIYRFKYKLKDNELDKSVIEETLLRKIFKDRKKLKKSTSTLQKLAAHNLLVAFTHNFDEIIKTMKGNSYYGPERIVHFKILLQKFNKLLHAWIVKFLGKKPQKMFKPGKGSSRSEVLKRIRIINHVLNMGIRLKEEGELKISHFFNASAAAIGSPSYIEMLDTADEKAHYSNYTPFPKTLEDVFTMIHQSLINLTSFLMETRCNIEEIKLPKKVQTLKQKLDTLTVRNACIYKKDVSVKRLGVKFQNNTIIFLYNIPLNQHSIQVTFSFDKDENTTELAVKFVGVNTPKVEIFEYIKQKINDMPLKKQEDLYYGMVLTFGLQGDTDSIKLEEHIRVFSEMMNGRYDAIADLQESSQSKKKQTFTALMGILKQ